MRASNSARFLFNCSIAALVIASASPVAATTIYAQDSLVTSGGTPDSDLINPWGLARSPTSPWWVADNGTAVSTLYNGAGAKQGLVVTIPGAHAAPTGVVYNGSASFALASGGAARFIFAGEDGQIAGWNGAQGTSAAIVAASGNGAIYKGLAIGSTGGADYLYATDFANRSVDVYNTSFANVTLTGAFIDPLLPAGYAPFGIQDLGGNIFVTYAEQGNGGDEVDGAHLGFVDEFNPDGTFVKRIASQGTLNAPWGLAIAPANFGSASGDLLVGNFGDGTISAFELGTDAFIGQLHDSPTSLIEIDGLWGLGFGAGGVGNSGASNYLYFTAGPNGETQGLFGDIRPTTASVPEPSTLSVFGMGLLALVRRRRKAKA